MREAAHRFDNAKRRRFAEHENQRMLTPSYLLEPVRELMGGFDLDPCTEADNPTAAKVFYALPQDGLAEPWVGETVWCNPPYGEVRGHWVSRCIEAARLHDKRVALLIPAATDTRIAQRSMMHAQSVLFVQGRLKFGVVRNNGRQAAATHGSMLLGFNLDLSPLRALGHVFCA